MVDSYIDLVRPLLSFTLTAAVVLILGAEAWAQPDSTAFESALETSETPWTDLQFANDPAEFQFAIVADRTGGRRDGVFRRAVTTLNRLRPEFVMSVGDLIEGYTTDSAAVAQQWDDFRSTIRPLKVPFFAVPGNHDISNDMMRRQWLKRYGAASYSFVYKDVLFVLMDSNDGDGVAISDEQISKVKRSLRRNQNVRWTFVFMHHPIWRYEDTGFGAVQKALEGRKHTVIAGHTHRYEHEVQSGNDYFILGTTGGGSELRGPRFGEFDHVTWVTVTKDQGPVFLNIALDGALGPDVSTPRTVQLVEALRRSARLDPQVLVDSTGQHAKIKVHLDNGGDRPLQFQGRFFHHHSADPSILKIGRTIGADTTHVMGFEVTSEAPFGDQLGPLQLGWTLRYEADTPPDFKLEGTYGIPLEASSGVKVAPEHGKFLDSLHVRFETPYPDSDIRYTTDGRTPTRDSPSYQGPFWIERTTTVKLQVVSGDGHQSEVVSKTFEKTRPRPPVSLAEPETGLSYRYFEGTWSQIPDFNALKPVEEGHTSGFDVESIARREDHFGIVYDGYVKVPRAALYTFGTHSDDGSKLYIGGELIVDNDGSHSARTRSGMVALQAGWHPVRIEYFEDYLGETLQLFYEAPGVERRPIPTDHFARSE